jgi:hypothetical protein
MDLMDLIRADHIFITTHQLDKACQLEVKLPSVSVVAKAKGVMMEIIVLIKVLIKAYHLGNLYYL